MSTGFTFGAKPATPAFGQSSFGAPATGSITFGTPAVQNPTPFGAATPSSTGFGSTGFGMSTFGTPAATTQSTGLTFGTPVASATGGFSLGTTPAATAPSTGLGFGAPTNPTQTAAPTFGFGTPASTAPSFGFGTPATTTNVSAPSFGFGTPATTGLTFGATTTSASTSFPFGTPAPGSLGFSTAVTTSAPSLGFGTVTTAQPSLGLGQPQTLTRKLEFGAQPTTTPAPTFNLNFSTNTTSAMPTFSLSTPTTTTSTGLNFGLGGTTQSTGLSLGLGGITTSLSLSKPNTTTTTATTTVGLGGIVQSTPKTEASTPSKHEIIPRDQQIPNELQQGVEGFKNIMKQLKDASSDIAKWSVKDLKTVDGDIDQGGTELSDMEKQLQSSKTTTERIKIETAKTLQNVEMAQRTMDAPPGFQYDSGMRVRYLMEMADNFEKEAQNLKTQIEYTDKYVRNFDKPSPLSSQDLAVGMKRLHETFVSLAGRFQTVHNQVEAQKEQYLNFRKYMLNDNRNVFEASDQPSNVLNINLSSFNYKPPSVATGPSPFNSLSHPSAIQAAVQNQNQTSTLGNTGFGNIQQPVNATGPSIFGNTPSLNVGQQATLQFNSPANTSFQLQKPPETRNKRGKQITY